MVFGPLIGAGVGVLGGLGVGTLIFSGDRPKNYKFLTESADKDDNINTPAVANITNEMRGLIPLTPEWTYWPDYDRWVMINRVVRLMWPKLTAAIFTEIIAIGKPILQTELGKIKPLKGVLEDITLGPHSLLDADHLDPHIFDKYLTLGDHPVRVAGMKVYKTNEDTCILETPLIWGSKMVIDLQVYVRVGPFRLVFPVHVSDVQFKVLSRVILHLVDTFPCMGGATLSLLEVPHVDFKLKVLGCPVDLMALPGVRELIRAAISYVVKEVALYPNCISVPLMPNFGVVAEPKGMLLVRVHRMVGFKSADAVGKSDPYLILEVREGRPQKSKVMRGNNNPEWEEEFYLVVDDLDKQALRIKLMDQDLLMPDDENVGEAVLYFSTEEIEEDPVTKEQKVVYKPKDWVARPMMEAALQLEIFPAEPNGLGAGAFMKRSKTLLRKLSKSLKLRGKGAEDASLGLKVIQVGKTRKQLRQEEEAARIAAQAEEERKALQAAQAKHKEAKAKAAKARPKGQVEDSDSESEYEWFDEEAERREAEKEKAEAEAAAAEKARLKAMNKEERQAWEAHKKAEAEAKKAEEEEVVLVDQVVTLRGNESTRVQGLQRLGILEVSVQFMPFEQPEHDDDVETKPVKEGLAQFIPFDPPRPREIITNVSEFQKGLLTVTLIGGKALGSGSGGSKSVDPYVELILVDCDGARPDERFTSRIVYNDSSPHWGDKFDFVMVSAGSMLTLNVWDHTSKMEMVASLKLSRERFTDVMLGKTQVPVMDVVRNGMLKDNWPLQQAESGTIEVKLEWFNLYVDDYVE